MRKLIFILTLFLIFTNISVFGKESAVQKEYKVSVDDGFTICATLKYPKVKNQIEYKTVILLHSLGYSSQWWENLPSELLNNGYAVLTIDLRGHGKSIYNSKLIKTSWNRMTNHAFVKYPNDIINVINYINSEQNKLKFFNNYAIVGSDIGGATAIIASAEMKVKPKTIVVLSPVYSVKGLYVPVKLAELGDVDIFSISGTNDNSSQNAQNYLKKFAQAGFVTYTSDSKSTGMLLLKNDPEVTKLIVSWLGEYLNN